MMLTNRQTPAPTSSFLNIFRPVFVIFSLYLLSDIFFRWDGFRHYASFTEFIPPVALITILWSVIAAIVSFFIWVFFKGVDKFSFYTKGRVNALHLKTLISIIILLGVAGIRIKHLTYNIGITYQVKAVLISAILLLALLITWLLRNSIGKWVTVMQNNITPLVWLFGVFFILSFPVIIYTCLTPTEKNSVHETIAAAGKKSLPNIILVTYDAMTTEDMSVYGYQRDTTPFIKEWAKDASVFTRAYSASTTTSTTTATLMTGKRLWSHLRFTQIHGGELYRSGIENLAHELKKSGLFTMSVATNGNASVKLMGVADSFDHNVAWSELSELNTVEEYLEKALYNLFGDKFRLYEWLVMEDFPLHGILSSIPLGDTEVPFPTKKTIAKFMESIDNYSSEPFFAWIHFHPPHAPYTPPEPFKRRFNSSSELIKRKAQEKLMVGGTLNKMKDLKKKRELLRVLRDRYDENMLYCDKTFENLIGELKERKKLSDSIIILSSDHGESFEHDYYGHGGTLYEASTHIPLIIRNYREPQGRVIDSLVGQEDIAATILGFAGLEVPSWMDGRSLVQLTKGKEPPPRPVFSMNLQHNTTGELISDGAFAIWDGDHKLIRNEGGSQMFDLKLDPGELNNIIDLKPTVAARFQEILEKRLSEANAKIAAQKAAMR